MENIYKSCFAHYIANANISVWLYLYSPDKSSVGGRFVWYERPIVWSSADDTSMQIVKKIHAIQY